VEFYELTPKQFHWLCRRHRSSLEGPEFMSAQTTAAIYNTGYKPEKQLTPLAFMPSQIAKKKKDNTAEPGKAVRMTKKRRQELASGANAVLMMMASAVAK
jgi:hypothetical protein